MGDGNGASGNGGNRHAPGENLTSAPDDARSEDEIIAWLHRDSAGALDALSRRSRGVADLVDKAGLDVAQPARLELRRNVRLTVKLLEIAFADLD